jgi:hypothetical protein
MASWRRIWALDFETICCKCASNAERMTAPGKDRRRKSLIWIGIIQHPFRNDEFVRNLKAWNTPSRTFLYESAAQEELAGLIDQGRVLFVDVFALSMVSNRWSGDCAKHGFEPMVRRLCSPNWN